MAYSIQITVDSVDSHKQADWWAQTLGWVVEPTDQGFIDSMLSQGFATEDDTVVHNGIRVWKDGAAICPADEVHTKGRRRILFQAAEGGKTGKNRVHWDVNLNGADKGKLRAELEARGATFLWEAGQGPHRWYTMADPEGNEFCIS